MTKSQNTKNEQQKDLCITSEQLTEQWKKGKLPSGWYWVEGCRDKGIYAYTGEYLNNMYRPRNSERIIEKVPSYDEYLSLTYAKEEDEKIIAEYEEENTKLKECNDSLNNRDINLCRIANEIRDENFSLKELLKECLEVLEMVQGETIYFPRTVDECIDKINEVLEEDK